LYLYKSKQQRLSGTRITHSKTLILLRLFAVIVVFTGCLAYISATTGRRGLVTGILYTIENSSAVIDNQIVYEGDVIYGVEVVEIRRKTVEFQKNGNRWKQRVLERPAPHWRDGN